MSEDKVEKTFDEKAADFSVRNHIHIGEELTISVNHIGTISFSSIGNSIEKPIQMFKVQSDIKILRVDPDEMRALGRFFLDVANKVEKELSNS